MSKPPERTEQVQIRLTPAERGRVETAAERDGRSMSDWIRRTIAAALEKLKL